jgi:hypothetical protein
MRRVARGLATGVLLLSLACGHAGIPRYAVTHDVRESAQRAVVVGAVRCEGLWQRHALARVRVELFVEGDPAPLASATSAADGGFQLASRYIDEPARPGLLRIEGEGWKGEAGLVEPVDQTYSVDVRVLCPADHPRGSTMLSADVTVQPIPVPDRP